MDSVAKKEDEDDSRGSEDEGRHRRTGRGPAGLARNMTVGLGKAIARLARNITVEPVMFFYMFAFMFTSVVEQAFYVDRACRTNLNFTDEICSTIERPENKDYKLKVQVEVSSFTQYQNIASNLVPMVLGLLLGAWSDRRGRKLPLLLGLAGQAYFSAMLAVVASQDSWPLEMVLILASFPAALTGTNLAIFMASFSYLTDITSSASRTLRISILDGVYLASMPTGIALGSYVFRKVVNHSFTAMFAINAAIMIGTFVYSLLRLEWQTTESQKPLTGVNICSDFFDWRHIRGSVRAVVRRRTGYRRLYLSLIILAMGLYTFQRNERTLSYLYTQLKFHWNEVDFSAYRTFQTATYVVVTLLAAPLLTKLLGVRDSTIVLFGAPAHAIARVIFALAEVPWLFYAGAAVSSLGPTVAPVLRSMTTKVVSSDERGKVFAVLTMADSAVPLISSVIYSQVYQLTIETYPAAIFWVTVISQTLVFFFILFIHLSLGRKSLEAEDAQKLDAENSS